VALRVLGVIPARGGSKGIANKNIAPLMGRPLLAYTADAVAGSRLLTRCVVSSDSPEIARVAQALGLDVPFLRPAELAQDSTPTIPVLHHAVRWLEEQGERFDAVMTLQPTNPLRRAEDIDGAIQLLDESGADSVISFVDAGEKHPARMKFIDEEGLVADPPFAEMFEGQPRQQLPKIYLREGSIYLTRIGILMEQNSLKGARCKAWIVPEERAVNIDTPFDLFLAEQIMRSAQCQPA
jgi:CMP-N,N'-diacetyllegionaminic acid synthase